MGSPKMTNNVSIMINKSYFYLVFGVLLSFKSSDNFEQQGHRLFKTIYDSQLQYFKDSIVNKLNYDQIIKFGKKSREEIYRSNGVNLNDHDIFIILEGVASEGGILTGVLFENGNEFSYKRTVAKGWQFKKLNISQPDSLSYYSEIGKSEIEKVRTWNIEYILKLKSTVGATDVLDGYNFIATRIDNSKGSSPKLTTLAFGEFNRNFQ
jgi:hypothetical protein